MLWSKTVPKSTPVASKSHPKTTKNRPRPAPRTLIFWEGVFGVLIAPPVCQTCPKTGPKNDKKQATKLVKKLMEINTFFVTTFYRKIAIAGSFFDTFSIGLDPWKSMFRRGETLIFQCLAVRKKTSEKYPQKFKKVVIWDHFFKQLRHQNREKNAPKTSSKKRWKKMRKNT